jgi:hypothetical protein
LSFQILLTYPDDFVIIQLGYQSLKVLKIFCNKKQKNKLNEKFKKLKAYNQRTADGSQPGI